MDETLAKQTFLRTEILEKGYDPSDFTDFLSQKRSDGDDLDNWSKKSLEFAVQDFQNSHKPEDSDSEDKDEKLLAE